MTDPTSTVRGHRDDLAAQSLALIRSGQADSGAFIASPTFGQYRYAWLRDGSFVAEALDLIGCLEEAGRFHDWVAGLIISASAGIERSIAIVSAGRAPSPADYLHCRYEVGGAVGPGDWPTFQLDGPGIWLWALAHHARSGGRLTATHLGAAALASRYLARLYDHPAYDAWEEFPNHVHTSTLAAILAGLRAARELGIDDGREAETVIADRFARHPGPFTKWDGSTAVDSSLLWLVAPYGLMTPSDPAFAATLVRIEDELVSPDGGVYRYSADTYYGGGEWLLLTAALGRTYLRRDGPGDRERARRCLTWIERQASPDGGMPEQVATNALHPERIAEWEDLWGPSACPLLWSHATYLSLKTELER
jgi:GH15 family glucan-1,4-alpha-glucosidase